MSRDLRRPVQEHDTLGQSGDEEFKSANAPTNAETLLPRQGFDVVSKTKRSHMQDLLFCHEQQIGVALDEEMRMGGYTLAWSP